MDSYLIAYIGLVLLYRFAETAVMIRTGTVTRRPVKDLTAWMIVIPYWLVIASTAIEYTSGRHEQPPLVAVVVGAILFAAATLVRVRAHLDLGAQFSMFIEEGKEGGLVTTGLYSRIRHPLYLANILLFLACPTFLAVVWAWGAALMGIIGVVTRIEIEEQHLTRTFEGYAAYAKTTWKLVPRIY
ncbi:MAG: isoprenylcysteine carboxylmethyltransferase family protein [Anaerolineae bacterium]|jgi:protein-S-isoprenylcysteine O-methyltransferase Ste14|nr:isoprenylcysteine carboxylmethyltransferase family protein [Anaerolineae bacterium]